MKILWKKMLLLSIVFCVAIGGAGLTFASEGSVIAQEGAEDEEGDRIRDFGVTPQYGWRRVLFDTLDRAFNPPSWFDGSGMKTSTTPSLLLRGSYYDAAPVVGESDYELRVNPALAALFETNRAKLLLRGKWNFYRYLDYETLNDEAQEYQAVFDTRLSELVSVELDGGFKRNNTIRSEFDDSEDESIPEFEHSDVTKYYVRPQLTIRFDPRNTLEMRYGYQDAEYDAERLYNYTHHKSSLTWLNLYTERTALYFEAGGELMDNDLREDGNGTEYTFRSLGGFQYRLSPKQTWGFRGGVRYTGSELDPKREDMTDNEWEFVALANLLWRFDQQRTYLRAVYSREQLPSNKGEFQEVDKVRLEFQRRLTEKWSVLLDGYWRRTATKGNVTELERDKFRIQPRLTYRPFEYMKISLAYRYYRINDLVYDNSEDLHHIFLQCVWDWPKTW